MSFSGRIGISLSGTISFAGNETGTSAFAAAFNASGVDTPTGTQFTAAGGYQGTFTAVVSAGTVLQLAHGTNVVRSGGTATSPIKPAQGYVTSGVAKLRALYIENQDPTNSVTVSIPATNGLAGCGWAASAVVALLQPLSAASFHFPAGSAVLTAGTNDGMVCVSSAGTPQVNIAAFFG